jgi:hypothetical protein
MTQGKFRKVEPTNNCTRSLRILSSLPSLTGARGGTLDWGTALQAGRSRVLFPMVSLEIFIDIILPSALWPWVGSASNRNEYQENFLGIKTADASGWPSYHPHMPIVFKYGSLNLIEPSGPLQACDGIALPLPLPALTPGLLHQGGVWSICCNIAESQSKPETA